MLDLPPHRLKLALLQPQIAPNTGNVARLCVAAGAEMHLVRPMGFVLGDRELRRSAMDYWPRLRLTVHDDTDAFARAVGDDRCWLFTSRAARSMWTADFADGDWLVFGNEPRGLDAAFAEPRRDCAIRIPQSPGERCLNLATAAGIGLYAALATIARPVD